MNKIEEIIVRRRFKYAISIVGSYRLPPSSGYCSPRSKKTIFHNWHSSDSEGTTKEMMEKIRPY